MGGSNPISPLLALAKQAGFTQESFESYLKDQKVLEGIERVCMHGAKARDRFHAALLHHGKPFRGILRVAELDKQLDPLLKS